MVKAFLLEAAVYILQFVFFCKIAPLHSRLADARVYHLALVSFLPFTLWEQ